MPYKVNISVLVADDHPLFCSKGSTTSFPQTDIPWWGWPKMEWKRWNSLSSISQPLLFLDIDMPYLTGLEVIRNGQG